MLKKYFMKSVLCLFAMLCMLCLFGCSEKKWDYNSKINKKAAEEHIVFCGIKDNSGQIDLPAFSAPYKVIDVSAWQEEIDFSLVKESGVKGVVLRLSRYNSKEKDIYFDRNYTEAKKHGLLVGCYYFMGAKSVEDAKNDAEKITKMLDENEYRLELPVFYDVEDEHDSVTGNVSSLGRQVLTDIIKTFCDEMRDNGYYAGYYSTVNFAQSEYYPEQLKQYPFWVARWSESVTEPLTYWMWQYSSSGQVPGVNGDCDMNLCFADFHTYIKENGFNNLNKFGG